MRSAQVNDLSTEAGKNSCNIWLIAWIIQTPSASKILKDWKASLCQSQPSIWCHDSHNQCFSQMKTCEVPCWAHPWQNRCQSPSWKELKPYKVHSMRYCLDTHYAKSWVDNLLLASLSKPASISVDSNQWCSLSPLYTRLKLRAWTCITPEFDSEFTSKHPKLKLLRSWPILKFSIIRASTKWPCSK